MWDSKGLTSVQKLLSNSNIEIVEVEYSNEDKSLLIDGIFKNLPLIPLILCKFSSTGKKDLLVTGSEIYSILYKFVNDEFFLTLDSVELNGKKYSELHPMYQRSIQGYQFQFSTFSDFDKNSEFVKKFYNTFG